MAKSANTGNKKAPAGRLRIVAGNWRSRLLEIADVPGLRPTSERVRETLFNWLAPRIVGARCLDLFAGTGALGLEALSRGATSVVFVERARPAVKVLEKNVQTLNASAAEVHHGDALEYLKTAEPTSFDIVFVDPPFAAGLLEEACKSIENSGILAAGGLVYLEQDRAHPQPALPAGWVTMKDKTAGQVRYSLIRTDP
jgi:16S rRNA (guanine966-N2)-methyltransferase